MLNGNCPVTAKHVERGITGWVCSNKQEQEPGGSIWGEEGISKCCRTASLQCNSNSSKYYANPLTLYTSCKHETSDFSFLVRQ